MSQVMQSHPVAFSQIPRSAARNADLQVASERNDRTNPVNVHSRFETLNVLDLVFFQPTRRYTNMRLTARVVKRFSAGKTVSMVLQKKTHTATSL